MSGAVLEARGLTKRFPGVLALDDVSMRLRSGSIHALLGENGAGKSTLIKILTGVHPANAGDVLLHGKVVDIPGIRAASELGIGVVHQERHLIPGFSIAENIMLDRLGPRPTSYVDYDRVKKEATRWLREMGLDLSPSLPVSRLSVAQVQLVEIAKALSLRSRVLFLDEPTASLTPLEADKLFLLLRKLRDDGRTLVFVSHKLEEVQEICDEVTVLRDGRNACPSKSLEGLNRNDLVQLMIGRSERMQVWQQRDHSDRDTVLELDRVATKAGHRDISFALRRGEVLGLYGLVGAGRTELAKAIIGDGRVTGGTVSVAGSPVTIRSVAQALHDHKIGYVSEDRKNEGLILIHSVLDNTGITLWRRLSGRLGWLRDITMRKHTEPVISRLDVRTPSLSQIVENLSGGNQQKISVAKWLAAKVDILIIDEPTVGIDINSKAYIHELIRDLAGTGTSILLITSDMPEMVAVADRILVMAEFAIQGEITNSRDYDSVSKEIMSYIHSAPETVE